MTHNNFSRYEIAQLCERYGPLVKLPAGAVSLDPKLILWALAGNESSFGANCKPRFEPAYFNGKYSKSADMQELIKDYGEDAAKSYGPWQLLLVNAPGFTPAELADDAEKAITATIGFLNRRIFNALQSVTLEEIADAYNSGNWRDSNVPHEYIANFLKHYSTPMVMAATGGVIHP